MKNEEKQLIENLFHKLSKVEQKSDLRNRSAEQLIHSFIKNQSNAPYYMTQTILVQDTVLKKLNKRIIELEQKISEYENELSQKSKNTGFLSNIFKKNYDSTTKNASYHREDDGSVRSSNRSVLPSSSSASNTGPGLSSIGNSFLGNALQTAVGVAGGMVVGNMLMNFFKHEKPEEEILTSSNDSLIDHTDYEEFDILNNNPYNVVSQDQNFLSDNNDFFDSNDIHHIESDDYYEDNNDDDLI
ncbi:Putative uncharacterized protein Yba2 [Buchnera aphidicola (Eriosoma grossulariae)]|uniref:DUF2076 domain-containing protein n=1 Tax=Buchnera aphidicola TaxID=9 RepID=UPI00346479F9